MINKNLVGSGRVVDAQTTWLTRGALTGNEQKWSSLVRALPWIGPALVLILGVVIYPVIALIQSSFSKYSIVGVRKGDAGISNYEHLFLNPNLPQVLWNTFIWVFAVVAVSVLLSLGLAQFLSKEFFGRQVVRWAVIVPWAAALIMSSQLFLLIFDYYYGMLNKALLDFHIISQPIDWLGTNATIMPTMIFVGIFVSLPFTTYLFVAGLTVVPAELGEAAKLDGAGSWQRYWYVTLPLLKPAILIGVILNLIGAFNSFPVIWVLNGRNPGMGNDTLITFMYKLAFKSAEHDVGLAASTSVLNVIIILIAVVIYMRFINWKISEEA